MPTRSYAVVSLLVPLKALDLEEIAKEARKTAEGIADAAEAQVFDIRAYYVHGETGEDIEVNVYTAEVRRVVQ